MNGTKLVVVWAPDAEMEAKIDRLFRENVRRREAIEKHRRVVEGEGTQSYQDRELWAVLGDDINIMSQSLWDTALRHMVEADLPNAIFSPTPCTVDDLEVKPCPECGGSGEVKP
jgi:hypothetical protein